MLTMLDTIAVATSPSIILAAVLGLFLAYAIVSYQKKPCPGPGYPIIGASLDYFRHSHRILDWINENTQKYGKTWSFCIPSQPQIVLTTTVEGVEHILKTRFDIYEKGHEFHTRLHSILGDGIFNADDELWKSQRKTASNIFSVNNFKDHMVSVFHRNSEVLLAQFKSKPLDMHAVYHHYTLDSIGEIAFGVNINSLTQEVAFQKSFDYAQNQGNHRFLRPYWRLHCLLNPAEWKMPGHLRVLNEFAAAVIAARREEVRTGSVQNKGDLLSLFMSRTDADGNPFSDTYLRDVIMNFTIAGRDTTAQTLSWATYMLSQHPEVERKMCEEIDSVLHGQHVDFEKLRRLTYTQAIFHETLRLYPAVPKDLVTAKEDDVLPCGTKVKAGTWVIFAPYVMGRDVSLWGKDAAEFKPERWIDEEGRLKKENQFKYPVFKAGPRICLGMNMANLEACSVLASIYSKYTLELVPGQTVTYRDALTMPMANGLYMTAKPREVLMRG